MSTSDKLIYLNKTKNKLKEAINLTNANITNDTFRSYEYKLKKGIINTLNNPKAVWDNFEKVESAETAGSITLDPTEYASMGLKFKGQIQQDSTTGKNKFSTDFKTTDNLTTYTKIDSNSYSFTCSGTWKGVTFVVPCKENTDYYFNYAKNADSSYCYIKGTQTNTNLMTKYYGYFNSFNSGANTTLTINISNGTNSSVTSGTISNIQLETGSTATAYEPYTNGASPNPDYPQDVHIVSGDNEIKVENRNRFNPNSIEQGGFNYHTGENWSGNDFIRNIIYNLKPNTQYTISCNESLGEAAICCFDENGSTLDGYTSGSTTNTYWSFTTKANTSYIKVRIGNATYPKTTSGSYNVCLVEGTSTDYVPHQEYTKEINLGVLTKNLINGKFRQGDRYTTGLSNMTRLFTTQNYKVKSGVAYTLSTDLNTTNYKYAVNLASIPYPIEQSSNQYYDSGWKQTSSFTFTPNQNGYLGIVVATSNGSDNLTPSDISSTKWQLELGESASTYEPYTPIEVGSIGDYDDEFFKNTTDSEYYDSTLLQDKWYLKKRVWKEKPTISDCYLEGNGARLTPNLSQIPVSGYCELYCTHFKRAKNYNEAVSAGNAYPNYLGLNASGQILCNSPNFTLKNDYIDFFNNNNIYIYYPLATPENILLNDTLQETLDSFVSYQEQTNISQENNDLPFVIKARAIKEIAETVD